ncbi:hypothetical protein ACHAQF_004062 [Verticillium nonalfalfae]
MSVPQSEAFKTAVVDSQKLTSKPSNDDLLQLYALFKIGNGEDIRQSPSPGMFDLKVAKLSGLQAKAKRSAWQKETDAGTTAEQAQAKYVELVDSLKKSHGYDADKVPESVGA